MEERIPYEEDEHGFTVHTRRSEEYVALLDATGAPEEVKTIRVFFPKDCSFFRVIRPDRLRRLGKHGLATEKLLVFEIPYVVTYSDKLEPALSMVNFTAIPERRAYFRELIFTEGYVSSADAIDLEDTIMHESMHLEEEEEWIRRGRTIFGDENQEIIEARVESMTAEKLSEKYGRVAKETSRFRSAIHALTEQANRKTLVSGYMEYWLHSYLKQNFEQYREAAIPMTAEMEPGEHVRVMEDEFQSIRERYKEIFGYEAR